jgi:hypothetical protein
MSKSIQFTVNHKQFAETALVEMRAPDASSLKDGEVLLQGDRFALTANNISYAATDRVYHDVLAGRTSPDHGHIVSLWESQTPDSSSR